MKRNHLGNQKGFTLVEIIAVLLLLGIMAAFALPKFIGMQRATEYQTLNIVLNDMKSRAVLAYSASVLQGNGVATAGNQTDFTNIGFTQTSDVTDAYKEFGGGVGGVWAWVDADNITYVMVNGGQTITFSINAVGSATDPMDIVMTALAP